MRFSKYVALPLDETDEKAMPSTPELGFEKKSSDSWFTAPKYCPGTVVPPTDTVSVASVPDTEPEPCR